MKIIKRWAAGLLSLFLIICILPGRFAGADGTRTDTYETQYLEITVPDRYVKLTQSTKDADPAWETAHIENPSQEKTQYKALNLVAAYFDPETNVTLNFISKSSSAFNVFDISGYTDEEMIEFAKNIVPSDESVKAEVSTYKHPQMNMFRIEFTFEGDNEDKELTYGTIINGYLLQFSMDTKHIGNVTIRDDILKEFVSGVKLTRIMTYEEYEENQKKGLIVIGCFFGGGILLMVLLYIITRYLPRDYLKVIGRMYGFSLKKHTKASSIWKDGGIDKSNPDLFVSFKMDKRTVLAFWKNIVRLRSLC